MTNWWENRGKRKMTTPRGANLRGANLERTNFTGANLEGANLEDAHLRGTNFMGANLRGTNFGQNHVLQIGPIGSRKDYLVVQWGPGLDEVQTGCWSGSLDEFEKRVLKTHGDNQYGQEYGKVITLLRSLRKRNERT